jgi:hypothetical protein
MKQFNSRGQQPFTKKSNTGKYTQNLPFGKVTLQMSAHIDCSIDETHQSELSLKNQTN